MGEEEIVKAEGAERFSGNFLLSLNGILFLGLLAAPAISFLFFSGTSNALNAPLIIAVTVLTLFFYLVFGLQAYYFLVSDSHLIVKNHLFRWYKKVYALDEISEATLVYISRRSNTLRITTKDFNAKLFSAGSLRKKTWKALLQRLHKHGIKVRNEVFV